MRSSGSTDGESERDSAALLDPFASELFWLSDIASLLMDEMTESASDMLYFLLLKCWGWWTRTNCSLAALGDLDYDP